jgi:hypothetical protein
MRKHIIHLCCFTLLSAFSITHCHAKALPAVPFSQPGLLAAIHVPPPVEQAFQAMLVEVAKDYGFHVSEITKLSTTWTKDKNVYSVTAQFGLITCDEEGTFNVLTAKFKANGTVVPLVGLDGKTVNYLLAPVNCIRAPF